jgi:outer membrane protein OmpA-like peptidoglycan-associated protein
MLIALASCGGAPPVVQQPPIEQAPPPPLEQPPVEQVEQPPPLEQPPVEQVEQPPPLEQPPVLSLSYEPRFFSPDNDGENDTLTITLGGGGEITSWAFDIAQPDLSERRGQLFRHFEGTGRPAAKIIWDGLSDQGELVQSATEYPYAYTVTGADGVVSKALQGYIPIDVLVLRQNDGRLKIPIPSIIFRPNEADFQDLPAETIASNGAVVGRIALILNKFPEYQIQVEGHANALSAPGTTARSDEEALENQAGSLSERRARAVLDLLIENGVDKSRLSALGKGIAEPVTEYTDRDNWWKNRRVEFFLNKKSP